MQMKVIDEGLRPGMKYGYKTELSVKTPLTIFTEPLQHFISGFEQYAEQLFPVA